MTRKRQRLYFVLSGMAILSIAAALVLYSFDDSLVFFHSPTDLTEKPQNAGVTFRLGGLVEEGSVTKEGIVIRFKVTDLENSMPVQFEGLLPDLFREGQGVVTEGSMNNAGIFVAKSVLAKHDENYMPPEVADSLKKAGHWQPEDASK